MPEPRAERPSDFILSLPKAELHLHLEGAIAPQTMVELSRRHGPELDLEAARRIYDHADFASFLLAFKAVTEYLRTPEDYELITYRLMERLRDENVLHAEVYVAVGVILWRGYEFPPIFEALERGRQRGERDFGVSLLWIFDATRHFGPSAAKRVADFAIRFRERNVAGIGIGGDEARGPAELFRDVYAHAAAHGLHLTAHAGETTGPESIWGALNLKAERLGHALTAWQDQELMAELIERQVPLEICVTSNLLTRSCPSLEHHPVRRYFDLGCMVTLNSDDPAMFHTTLAAEYALAQRAFGFTDEHLREIARNSFEASFLPAEKKVRFLELVDAASPA